MSDTSIQWTDKTWNPTRGCSLVSQGCTNCYAMKQAHRFSGPGGKYEGLTRLTSNGPVWTGEVRLAEDKLEEPLHWKKPARVFVNSMSDLFHERLDDEAVDKVFAVMALCPQHTFQVLTKRPERMFRYFSSGRTFKVAPLGNRDQTEETLTRRRTVAVVARGMNINSKRASIVEFQEWPLLNVWLLVSVENQETADERVPWLLKTPAAVRGVSYEPALGPVRFSRYLGCADPEHRHFGACTLYGSDRRLKWIVVGGESGPGARPFDLQWARDTIAQCKAAGVRCFVKQLGAKPVAFDPQHEWFEHATKQFHTGGRACLNLRDKKGGDISEWPPDLRVREFPGGE